ncbi:MAG: tetratricopeptide repeat protein, partial [Planctomyces sp.]
MTLTPMLQRILILLGVLAFCVAGYFQYQQLNAPPQRPAEPSSAATERPAEIPIPEPFWGQDRQDVRKQLEELRAELASVQSRSDVAFSELARAYGHLGETYLAYDIPAPAIPCFQNAGLLEPSAYRWQWLQALAHAAAIDTAAAAEAAEKALELMRQDPTTAPDEFIACLCFLGDARMRLGQLAPAKERFTEVLNLEDTNVFALFRRAQLAAAQRDDAAATADFEKAISLSGEATIPGPLCVAVAGHYQKTGRTDDAARYRQLASTAPRGQEIQYRNPTLNAVRSRRKTSGVLARAAEREMQRGDFLKALDILEEALRWAPESPELHFLRAAVFRQQERFPDALKDLEPVLKSDANWQEARQMRIEICARINSMHNLAYEEAARWRMEKPDDPRPLMTFAEVCLLTGRFEEARNAFLQAAERMPDQPDAALGTVSSECALGKFQSARELLEKVTERFIENGEPRLYLARFLVTCPDEKFRDPPRGLALIKELLSSGTTIRHQETLACALAEALRKPNQLWLL